MKSNSPTIRHAPERRGATWRSAAPTLAAVVAVSLAAGCAKRDSIVVGAIPDDYRTNHPIVISEQEKRVDIPVGMRDSRASSTQRLVVEGFIADYDKSARPMVTIMVPSDSANAHAASAVAADLVPVLRRAGVPEGRILHQPYQSGYPDQAAPIRVSYHAMTASTGPCGRWPADIADTTDNRHYANFGCAYQNNLAAQVANPADLLGPRKPGEIDATRRSGAIDDYQNASREWNTEVNY